MYDEKGRLFFTMDVTFNSRNFAFKWEYNTSCPLHKHGDYYEILFVTKGAYINVFDNVPEAIPEGTILLFNAETVHEFHSTGKEDSHFVFAGARDSFEQFTLLHFPGINFFKDSPYTKITLSETEKNYMTELAQLSGHPKLGNIYIDLFLYNTLAQVLTCYNTPNPICDRYVFDIIEKINDLTYIRTPVMEIYNNYPISASHLSKLFEKRTGMGIKKFQVKRKMEYAANLLLQTDKSITDIAEILDIDSLSHFINLFKKTYGISPSAYRTRHKND